MQPQPHAPLSCTSLRIGYLLANPTAVRLRSLILKLMSQASVFSFVLIPESRTRVFEIGKLWPLEGTQMYRQIIYLGETICLRFGKSPRLCQLCAPAHWKTSLYLQHWMWRRQLGHVINPTIAMTGEIRVADIACGTGHICNASQH